MKILIANDGKHAHYYQRMAWAKAFEAMGIQAAFWNIQNTPAFDVFDRFEPDVFLGQSYNLDKATVKCIYERPHLKVGLRAGDWGYQTDDIDRSKFNILTCTQKEIDLLKKMKDETGQPEFVHIHYTKEAIVQTHNRFAAIGIKPISLMMCADITAYSDAKFDDSLECDIGFVGGFWPYKGQVIKPYLFPLLNPVGKYRTKIFGNQPWQVNQYCGMIADHRVKDLFVSAKICPNLSEPHAQEFGFDVNERIFKILYAGGFCISDNIEGYKTTFNDLVPLADNPEDFKELVDHYLKNPGERIGFATKGQKYVKENHTSVHRICQILEQFEYNEVSKELMERYKVYLKNEQSS